MESSDGDCSFQVSPETERFLCERLLDQKQPMSERFRALFSLRNLRGAGPRNALIQATRDSSNLLAHEAAFALGQMQDAEAIPALEAVLNDLFAMSLASDPAQEVRETCELALSRIEELKSTLVSESSPFLSVDPAAPAACSSVRELREVLLNEDKSMYERYAALFALRNLGEEEAISAIVESLGANSALLRHEGNCRIRRHHFALSQVLRDVNEHPMVRHEAAEALGSIADNQCIALLEEFAKDPEPIVSQSCEVALSMLEFERSGKSFEVTENKKDSESLRLYLSLMVSEIYSSAVPFHAGTSSAAGIMLSSISVYERSPTSVCLIESNESHPIDKQWLRTIH
ncbi:UNVERIFIED_CONTAM: Deoxyhypusine hydroxylase-A [Sesamum latifolium]|uniref:Deoxyhypusine hydroxylase-A n=1 Tax=Sesamum latifolium TaxID=2727402 RepID=A0AAW2Y136_9LAMI